MAISEKNEKQEQTASVSEHGQAGKKNYQSPRFFEYGNVATLTQMMTMGSFADMGAMMVMMMT